MSVTLQITGPATLSLIEGVDLFSLDLVPPGGLELSDTNAAAVINVTITGSVGLSASSAGGATVTDGSGSLRLIGDLAQVNAALASLQAIGTLPGGSTVSISATDGSASAATVLAVETLPDAPPAFVAPPTSLTLAAGIGSPVGLVLADDPAAALGTMGEAPEHLTVTLLAETGALLLDPATYPGIEISGDATGAITLSTSSAALSTLNIALGAVQLITSTAGTLEYIARQEGGPLPAAVSSGSLVYTATGSIAANTEIWRGGGGSWQTGTSWFEGSVPGLGSAIAIGSGATLNGYGVGGSLSLLAGASAEIEGQFGVAAATLASAATLVIGGALSIAGDLDIEAAPLLVGASGTLNAAGVTLGTGGALIGFGAVTLNGLDAQGTALLPGGALLDGPIAVQSGGVIDFAGLLQADSMASTIGLVAISLASGSTIEGAGTLVAGNFSESDAIIGSGTILALGPAPLIIAAGSIGGGAHLAIAPGAALELGAIAPLYGVFDATPITVGSDATISFASGASDGQDNAGYASTLGEQGGVLVLDNPESFAGTIFGFLPGDRIDLPTLTNLSVFNVTTNGFDVAGEVVGNTTQSEIVTIHANLAGLTPSIETDTAGDAVIGLRPASAQLTLNDMVATDAQINAVSGIATPIEGLGLLVPSNGSAGLTLTITAIHGQIALNGGTAQSSLTLSAANALSLNAELATLNYTASGNGNGDVLDFTGGIGLFGLSAAIGIAIGSTGTLDFIGSNGSAFNANASWQGGIAPANGDIAAFVSHAGAPVVVTGPGIAAALSIGGAYDFAGMFDLPGSAGVALDIGGGGFALFDANAGVSLGNTARIGDPSGAGTLGIGGTLMAPDAVFDVGGVSQASGSLLEITGTVAGAGLALGIAAAGTFDLTGTAGFGATTLGGTASGAAGLLRATGNATLGLGTLDLVAGTIVLSGSAVATAGPAVMSGGAITLAGDSVLDTSLGFNLDNGILAIGAEALQSFGTATFSVGAVGTLDLYGSLTGSAFMDAGTAMLDGGAMVLSGVANLANGASLDLAAGTLTADALTIAYGATLEGSGEIVGIGLSSVDSAGSLIASGGTLILGGSLSGNAGIDAGAALDLAGPAAGGTIAFNGNAGLLTVNDIATMQDSVANMIAGDAIDLIGIAPAEVGTAGSTISVAGDGNFTLREAAGQGALAVTSDGYGGSEITIGGAMPCFTRGSRLLTPHGYRPVEYLRPGDDLITRNGIVRRIVWIGWRSVDLARDPAAALLRPVVIAPGAFGPRVPQRPLALSPLHAIYVGDRLIPAVLLVNGSTIIRDDTSFAATYFHIELDRHDIVHAENLPVETYRDNGNRDRFVASTGTPGVPVQACAPLVLGGLGLCAARTALHRRALELGHKIVHGPETELRIDTPQFRGSVLPRRHAGRFIFDLPAPTAHLFLHSRAGQASYTDPASEDRRALGICAGALWADGRRVVVWHGAGWHCLAPGDRGLWSTAAAEIRLPRLARRLSLVLLGSIPRWVRDPASLQC